MYNTLKALIILLSFILFTACREKKYHIGVSQCIHNDWNRQLIKDLQREDNSYPEVELDISHNVTNVSEQIADVRRLIKAKVDLIMILPEAAEALSPVVDEAAAAGIPVILIDSETASTNYTARVSVDNRDIGIRGGQFASYSLNGHGKVIEVLGVKESSSTLERRRGFHDVISNYPDIQVIDSCETNWTYESAFPLLDSLIALHPDVDLIAAYNDPLAIAAYDACQKHNLNKKPIIMGIDALAGEGQGIQCVLDGKIDATCTNPTCGLESFQLALDILEGRPYERVTKLPTQLIDRNNVQMVLRQEQHIEKMNQRIEAVNGRLGKYLERSNILQLLILAAIFLIALIIGFVIYVIWAMQQRAKLRKRIEDATQAKLTFFSNVSHSCRTPLTLIAGPIQTILEEGGLTERQKELIALMGHQADELMKIADKVLNMLQDDLFNNGERLDAIANQSVQSTSDSAELRKESNSRIPFIDVDESRKSILVIDDNGDIRKYLTMVLQKKNYLVITASNGEEGLLLAKQNIPDLIICDVMMPVMNGLECCRLLKADQATSHIPVLLLSAYALDDHRIQGYRSGADAYITKPFNSDVLLARIDNLINSRKYINPAKDRYKEMTRAEFSDVDRSFYNHFHSFVSENISNADLDIQQLSEEFNMSRVQLYRKCKSITGKSPIELIRLIRLKAADRLLHKSNKTVSEIAYEVGFSSPSYFAKCYKEQFNESPTDVQKRNKESQ